MGYMPAYDGRAAPYMRVDHNLQPQRTDPRRKVAASDRDENASYLDSFANLRQNNAGPEQQSQKVLGEVNRQSRAIRVKTAPHGKNRRQYSSSSQVKMQQ